MCCARLVLRCGGGRIVCVRGNLFIIGRYKLVFFDVCVEEWYPQKCMSGDFMVMHGTAMVVFVQAGRLTTLLAIFSSSFLEITPIRYTDALDRRPAQNNT